MCIYHISQIALKLLPIDLLGPKETNGVCVLPVTQPKTAHRKQVVFEGSYNFFLIDQFKIIIILRLKTMMTLVIVIFIN